MIDTPPQEEHKPDGLNILAGLLQKIKDLEERIQVHEERFNNWTLSIPEQTVNALVARTLHMHAQVLQAAITPQPAQEEPQEPKEAAQVMPSD